jgi:hypothetical protein
MHFGLFSLMTQHDRPVAPLYHPLRMLARVGHAA